MFPIIQKLQHYNTPGNCLAVEGIVQSPSNRVILKDRLPYNKYHHRNRHGIRNPAESTACHRGRFHTYWCRDVHWQEELKLPGDDIQLNMSLARDAKPFYLASLF